MIYHIIRSAAQVYDAQVHKPGSPIIRYYRVCARGVLKGRKQRSRLRAMQIITFYPPHPLKRYNPLLSVIIALCTSVCAPVGRLEIYDILHIM